MSNFVEPTPERVAQMIAHSGVGGYHDGNVWDVTVRADGARIEIDVIPADKETGDNLPGYAKTFRFVVG